MTKEQLESLFYDKFEGIITKDGIFTDASPEDIKDFIFGTVIKEVLKSVAPSDGNDYTYFSFNDIKQKAKEQFNIDL